MSRSRRLLVLAGLLVAATLVAYVPAMSGGFIWDDDAYVEGNLTLRTLDGLRRIWLEPTSIPQYYPLVHTSFWIEYHLWGLRPLGYHVVNVLLHATSALLLWRLLARLGVPGAPFAAALFALHPVHVESVAWVTERKNVLSGVFYLGAALAYLRFARDARPLAERPWGSYALAALLFAAALLSKTVTASLPAALLLVLVWRHGRRAARELGPLLPLFALGLTMGLYTAYLEKTHVGAEGGDWDYGAVDRVLIAGRVVWFYAQKLVWPHPLIFIYERWEVSAAAPWQYVWPAGVVLAVLGLWLARRRIGSGPLVAVLFFIGTLVPCLGFVDVYPMRFSYVADHFQYHASIGLLALAAAAGATLLSRAGPPVRVAAAALVLSVLGALTWRQGYVYESARTLWEDTIAKNPDAFLAHHNLGYLYAREGDFERARELIRHSFELNPRYEVALNSMGVITLQIRPLTRARLAEAAGYFQRAVEVRPVYFKARFDLAKTLYLLGRVDAAYEEALRAHRISPTHEGARRLYEQLSAARAARETPGEPPG